MLTKTFLITSLFYSLLINAQYATPFKLQIDKRSNWNIKIDTISATEGKKTKPLIYKENQIDSDSLLEAITAKFPKNIIRKDSCLILKGNDKLLTICTTKPLDIKQWGGFNAYNFVNGFLILQLMGYESEEYLSYNPDSQKYFYTHNVPTFLNNEIVYAYGNYYLDGQFQIFDLEKNKYFGFEFFDWELTKFYKEGSQFYLELVSRFTKTKKYLRLDYQFDE